MKLIQKYQIGIYNTIQIVLGVLFIVSGFVKGVDPVGVSYKVREYLELFGLGFFDAFALWISTVFCAVEIFIGLMLLVGVYKKVVAFVTLLFMFGFTAITFYLVIDPSSAIQECGCFGDAIKLTNTETFFKNIFFITLSVLYFWRQVKDKDNDCQRVPSSSYNRSIHMSLYLFIIALMIPAYSIHYLPPFDFLPFNRGVNVLENMTHFQASSKETKLVHKNKKNGEIVKFEMNDTIWQDVTTWEYINTETSNNEGNNSLSRFAVYDKNINEVTSEVLADNNYTFIIIAQQIGSLTDLDFKKLNKLYELSKEGVISLYLFTSSDLANAENIIKSRGWNINAYNVDQITLKSMIRNDKGVMMLNNGVIGGKWNLKQGSFRNLNKGALPKLVQSEKYVLFRFYSMLIGSALVLSILMFFKYKVVSNQKEREVTGT